jgi:hypothetical protein
LDIAVGNGTKAFQIWDDNNTSTPRFIVERTGNVGIGTADPKGALQIGSTFPITMNSNYPDIHFNSYYSAPYYRTVTTGYGSKISFNGATGVLSFVMGPNSTIAGNDYSPATAMTIANSGIVDTLYKIKEHNGTKTHTERFYLGNNIAYTFDIAVPNEGGAGNSFLVNCGYNHYYVAGYGAHHSAWYSGRGTNITQVLLLGNQTSTNGGAWSVSKPSSTTLRITKSAGTYGGAGSGFLQVTWSATVG